MAIANKYDKFLLTQMNGGQDTTGNSLSNGARIVNYASDNIKLVLLANTYTPDPINHATISDVDLNTHEIAGTGYTAGGITLGNPNVSEVGGDVFFKADNVQILEDNGGGGFANARYAIIYKDSGVAATSTLICYIDFGSDKGNTTADFGIQFHPNGLIKWS